MHVGVGGKEGPPWQGECFNALEMSSKEQKREEDNGSYFYLLVHFSTAGHILHLPLLISFLHG